jgi:hypothetical protein
MAQVDEDSGETAPSTIPVAFRDVIRRLNDDFLPKRGERLIYQQERQCWRLVKLSGGDALSAAQVEKLARTIGAIAKCETVV